MTVDPRTPCVIGVAQRTHRAAGGDAPEPLDQWEQVARAAAADATATAGVDGVLGAIGSLGVTYCQSWTYDDGPRRLAERLGIDPAHRVAAGIGGTTPHHLVADAAAAIRSGELEVALVCGAEALATKRRMKKAGSRPAWSHPHPDRPPFPFEAPFHPAEVAHEVFAAWLTFALFDIARRAHLDVAPAEDRRLLGELLAPMTRVAAANPHAWFPIERTVDELVTPTAENRMVGFPYTKVEVAVMDVDMGAALLVASHGAADDLGVPADRRVYLRGWASANDPVYVAEHPDLWRSPALAAATAHALGAAGVGIDAVAHLDLYSCFGSSVRFALDALGVAPDDDRGVTVTGGLPFAGGPGSGYLLHAMASMVERLRDDPGALGLTTGVGMHMTKHSAAVWSTDPGPMPPTPAEGTAGRSGPDDLPVVELVERHAGPATVATYSVVHGRDGDAQWGLAVCDLPAGGRCYARIVDRELLAHMEEVEWVGTSVELVSGDAVGLAPEVNVVAT